MHIEHKDERFLALISGIEEILEAPPGTLSGATDFKAHPNWDSLAALSTMVHMEDLFQKVVDPAAMKRAASIGELYDAIADAG